MIAITPEILGPGIEEEYADALAAIDDMRVALGDRRLTNDTPEGRVLLNILWVQQQIAARTLPIPVHQSFVATIFHLVGSHELERYPGFQPALVRLWLVLKGYGLMKPRHVPVLVAMLEDVVAEAAPARAALTDGDRGLLDDMSGQAADLRAGGRWPKFRPPEQGYYALASDAVDQHVPGALARLREIDASLFEGWRPRPARKPPLPAPVPGLPEMAPMLPPDARPV